VIHNETIVRPLYVDSHVPGTAAAPGDDGELPPLLAAATGDDGQLLPLPAATPRDDRLSGPPFLYARHPNPTELYSKVPFPLCCGSGSAWIRIYSAVLVPNPYWNADPGALKFNKVNK
jgi:hypothetical protein